nr:unnamed protein product [Digitaria exilis]
MNGSASAAAAEVADTRGGEAPSDPDEETGNVIFVTTHSNFTHPGEDTYQHGQPVYFPEELVDNWVSFSRRGLYYCYNISLRGCLNTISPPTDIILAVKCDMGPEFLRNSFNLGGVQVTIQYLCIIPLNLEQVIFARRFQMTILSLLTGNDYSGVTDAIKYFHELQVSVGVAYLLLPSVSGKIDWCGIKFSTSSVYDEADSDIRHCHSCKDADLLQTMDGPCCRCRLQNSVVYIPRDRKFYCVTGFLDLNANDQLHLRDRCVGSSKRYGLPLTSERNPLLDASGLFTVQNFLNKCYEKGKEPSSRNAVKLPPELCRVVMAPVSTNTLCSFSFVPSIMYRIQCLLLSAKLKIQLGPRMKQFNITALKILEALTTKECQEEFSQESLETLGDSFLNLCHVQRLEFLGDAVLDHILTDYFYKQYYPGCTPALLTDLRKASAHRMVGNLALVYLRLTAGIEENLIESIAGAIYLDSKYKKEVVWRAMRRLLEPLVTPKTVEVYPVSELKEICERRKYLKPLYSPNRDDVVGVTKVVASVKAAGTVYHGTGEGRNQKVAKILAAKALLKKLKASSLA